MNMDEEKNKRKKEYNLIANLDRIAEQYCGELRNRGVMQCRRGVQKAKSKKKARRLAKQQSIKKQVGYYWDYPVMVSVCSDGHLRKKRYSDTMLASGCNRQILSKIKKLGEIGEISQKNLIDQITINDVENEYFRKNFASVLSSKRNYLGRCAEQHSGNAVLNANVNAKLSDLYFSCARYVRNSFRVKACLNCLFIFPKVNLIISENEI